MKGGIQKRIRNALLFTAGGVLILLGIVSVVLIGATLERDLADEARQAAAVVAAFMDGDLHQEIRGPEDATSPAFRALRDDLRRAREALDLPAEQIYTIRPVAPAANDAANSPEVPEGAADDSMEFVVMTHPEPFIGDRLARKPAMTRAFENGEPTASLLYETETGTYISGFAPIRNTAGEIVALVEVDRTFDVFQRKFWTGAAPVVGALLLGFALLAFIANAVAGRIAKRLRLVIRRLEELQDGAGDLTQKLNIKGDDEVAEAARLVDAFVESTADVVREVQSFSRTVDVSVQELRVLIDRLQQNNQQDAALIENATAANEELTASLKEIDERAQSQDRSLRETRPGLEQLLQFVIRVEQNARSVHQNLKESSALAERGSGLMTRTRDEVDAIARSSEEIDSIVNLIQGIADRIAMLSLNASIEAARAGEFGRGFAVVADEVSKLSESTSRQIKDIAAIAETNRRHTGFALERTRESEALYQDMRHKLEASVKASQENFQQAEGQRAPAEKGLAALEDIAGVSRQTAGAVAEQLKGAEEADRNMQSLNDLAEQLSGMTQEILNRIQELEARAGRLQQMLGKLKV